MLFNERDEIKDKLEAMASDYLRRIWNDEWCIDEIKADMQLTMTEKYIRLHNLRGMVRYYRRKYKKIMKIYNAVDKL